MNVILYRIPHLQYGKNNTINFSNDIERDAYFNSISDKIKLSEKLSPNWIKNIWKLNNDVTIYDEGRYPYSLYNYMMIDNGDRKYYFYITDYEESGNNQVKYHLVMDTLITYVTTPGAGVDIEANDALILREHKNRFEGNTPIFDKEIEELDITPNVVKEIDVKEGSKTTLVLKQIGGNVSKGGFLGLSEEGIPLSEVKYLWELYGSNKTFEHYDTYIDIPLGFGVKGDDLHFRYINNDGETEDIYIYKDVLVRHVIDEDGFHYLEPRENLSSSDVDTNNTAEYKDGNILLNGFNKNSILKFEALDALDWKVYADLGMRLGQEKTELYFTPENDFIFGNQIDLNTQEKMSAKSRKLDQLNRSASINQKIIELPYTPNTDFLVNSFSNRVFIKNLQEISFDTLDFEFEKKSNSFDTSKIDKLRVKYNDPKLYTSQFRPNMISWLGDSILIKRENFDDGSIDAFRYDVNLNKTDYSKALLSMRNLSWYNENKPYDSSLIVDLKNESASMSSDYNDYINNMLQNDLKLIRLQDKQAQRDMMQSAVNVVGSGAKGAITGALVSANPASTIVGAGVGVIQGVANLGFQMAKAEDAKKSRRIEYANKMNALKSNLVNIAGGSIDLLDKNESSLVKLFEIEPYEYEIDYLDKYFHKYGYQTLELKKPKLRTRKYFDYKQMLIDELEEYAPVTEEVKMDIIDRFEKGVTIYHVGYSAFSNHFTLDDPEYWTNENFIDKFDLIKKIQVTTNTDIFHATSWEISGDNYFIDLDNFDSLVLRSNGTFESLNGVENDYINANVYFEWEELIEPDFNQEKENWEVD